MLNIGIISIGITTGLSLILFGRFIGEIGSRLITKLSIILISIFTSGLYINLDQLYLSEILINNWISSGISEERMILEISKQTIIMTTLIVIITSIVLIYSIWYLNESKTFLGYLWLFASSMLLLVNSSNLLLLYLSWELVGIMSYILINYWYKNNDSNKSSLKAILYNKIGDIALLLFIFNLILISVNTKISIFQFLNSQPIIFQISSYLLIYITIATMAKSSLFFLFPWLGDAMAGPTPVSALLHAATMVTAGIFLTNRLEIIEISDINIIIGIITILLSGLASLFHYDIKKIIAYSTASQLGYMYIGSIVLSKDLSLFHLFTHGYFKALLFLTAGIIIHSYLNEQDIRRFNIKSIKGILQLSIASLSLSAIPYLSGYYSKDLIIENSLIYNTILYYLLLLGSILTILYSFRLIYISYLSYPSVSKLSSDNHSDDYNQSKLTILIVASIIIGYIFKEYFIENNILVFDIYHHIINSMLWLIPLFLPLFILYFFINTAKLTNLLSTDIYVINNRKYFVENIINLISDFTYYISSLYEKHIEYLFDYFTLILYTRLGYTISYTISSFNLTILDIFIFSGFIFFLVI